MVGCYVERKLNIILTLYIIAQVWKDDVLLKSSQVHNGAILALGVQQDFLFTGGWDKIIKASSVHEIPENPRSKLVINCDSVVTALLCHQGKLFAGFAEKAIKCASSLPSSYHTNGLASTSKQPRCQHQGRQNPSIACHLCKLQHYGGAPLNAALTCMTFGRTLSSRTFGLSTNASSTRHLALRGASQDFQPYMLYGRPYPTKEVGVHGNLRSWCTIYM
eukprot:Gb_32522 [translate_table: standard]